MSTRLRNKKQPDEPPRPLPLPEGITSDYVDCTPSCGLKFHVLKAGEPGKPLVLFCHGFPELAFSWRKILPKVAEAGYYCVAPDQRGYGRTLGWERHQYFPNVELGDYTMTNLVRDLVCLVYGLGYTSVHSIIGHDFGAVGSAMAALMRPDMFRSTIQMSHPHHPPPLPPDPAAPKKINIQHELSYLQPPRSHYKWHNAGGSAASDWENPPQGIEKFLRGYFHVKSADWDRNDPRPLKSWSAKELAVMPEYYIMRDLKSMAETVMSLMNGEDFSKTERWLSKQDLQVYCDDWTRNGYQGALNWYRAQTETTPQSARDMYLCAGRKIEVPCVFISGKKDWGTYQQPGALESYTDPNCVKESCFRGVKLLEGAGHWVQQEQPEVVIREILAFFDTL
ncbi:alpha/beta-hydrolase [Annulohypoxylon truncatum]|uniref:alpha/beta-hydrolase n=1 Tax=Annulohypoxylon truncatum TaxID=327061 RepID=UPI002008EAEC|nr:alpha/beta-hydrolase [Annulohypoxylon truncatum]KAI1211855.1 alpha/beta-hydrolase [Annulohypoxylon truncatum]